MESGFHSNKKGQHFTSCEDIQVLAYNLADTLVGLSSTLSAQRLLL